MNKILNKKLYIIAEAGVNHNGDIKLAKKLIRSAKVSGADAIKFQIFEASSLATVNSKKAEYQIKNTKKNSSQLDMLRKLELKKKNYFILKKYAKKQNIDFLNSVFDIKDYFFLLNKLKDKIVKIPSGEINNYPLINEINVNKTVVLLSTGMTNLKEITDSLNKIINKKIYKYINSKKIRVLDKKYLKKLANKICIMHCVTDYPVKDNFANLDAIESLSQFRLKLGYSDHTVGSLSSIIAVSKGAIIIEKHFTLNKKMKGPDHKASMDPREFKKFVQLLKNTILMRGNGIKNLKNVN